jgi:hypothetical protein
MGILLFIFWLLAAGGKEDSPCGDLWPLHTPEQRDCRLMILDFRLRTACTGLSIENLQSEIYNLQCSLVRDHAQYFGEISVTHQATVTQLALALGALGSQDVTQVRTSTLHFPGCSFLEALGGAFVGF